MVNETWKFVQQAKSKQAMKQVILLGIRDEKTPPLAHGRRDVLVYKLIYSGVGSEDVCPFNQL